MWVGDAGKVARVYQAQYQSILDDGAKRQ